MRFFKLFVLALAFISCSDATEMRMREAVKQQMETYPESRLQDIYKSCFQDRFGPGHIISNRESAKTYIISEMEGYDDSNTPYLVSCGWEGNYIRVSLDAVKDGLISVDELTDALMQSAEPVLVEDIEAWKGEWQLICSIVEKLYPELPDLAEDKQVLDSLLGSGNYVFHHSKSYNAAYKPHYRIIKKDLLDQLPVMR